jgi:hypothetical protein
VAAAPGLISDTACARSLVAAETINSAAAASPRNLAENLAENPAGNLAEYRQDDRKDDRNE